jgi:uncharacterized protein GlcG (DUF336 family)
VAQAASYAKTFAPHSTICVIDREGFVLGIWTLNAADPSTTDIATVVSKAGTAAYLSSNDEAFTSLTAGFIIQQHFPPGVDNTSPGPLVGVGFSNLPFSDVNFFKGPGSPHIPLGQSSYVRIQGTSLSGSPGGVPLYKNGILVGGIGVIGDGAEGFGLSPNVNESVALAGQSGYAPSSVIAGSGVFINGIRVAYLSSSVQSYTVSSFGSVGHAVTGYDLSASLGPLPYPKETIGGQFGEVRSPIISDPISGAINGQARLTSSEVRGLLDAASARAAKTRAGIRLPGGKAMQVFISVINNPNQDGVAPSVLGTFRTPDATFFSWDVSVQKARTALFFSNNTKAMSTRAVGFLAQSLYPPGINGTTPGPFNGLQEKYSVAPPNPNLPNGITIFPGGFPLYRNGQIIGAIGISGDGVDQDDLVAASGAAGLNGIFLAPEAIRADQFDYLGARLPYAKFPRNPDLNN